MHMLDGVKELRFRFVAKNGETISDAMFEAEEKSNQPLGGKAPEIDSEVEIHINDIKKVEEKSKQVTTSSSSAPMKLPPIPDETFDG